MIIKGSARAAPGELALHLLRVDTNESVCVLELHGVASLDVAGALAELDGMGAGSRSKRTLYHASINTPIVEQLTPEQQRIARDQLAEKLGLANQPYAVVQHIKHGRQHTHVVWSRIDVETGRAIPDSHNYRKHEEVSRDLERQFGHELVLGAHVRDKEHEPRPPRGPTWGEQRQAERSGFTADEAKAMITDLWRQTTTGHEFKRRLEQEGFTFARGDRRDFVLIDHAGGLHGLTRRIEGVNAAEVRQRMADIDANELPDVKKAREDQRQRLNLRPAVPQEISQEALGISERLRAEELRLEREGKGGKPAALSGSHGEIADAIYQLNKTMRGQVSDTIVNSQSLSEQLKLKAEIADDRATGRHRVPAEYRERVAEADKKDPTQQTPAERNLIRPVTDPQQKSMDDIAARIQANLQAKHQRGKAGKESRGLWQFDMDKVFASDEANRQRMHLQATPREIAALDREVRQLASGQAPSNAQPAKEARPVKTTAERIRERQQGGQQLRQTTPRPKLNLRSNDRERERGD